MTSNNYNGKMLLHDLDFMIRVAEFQIKYPQTPNVYGIASDTLMLAKEISNWYSRDDILRFEEKREVVEAVRDLMPQFLDTLVVAFIHREKEAIGELKRIRDGISLLPDIITTQNANNKLLQQKARH